MKKRNEGRQLVISIIASVLVSNPLYAFRKSAPLSSRPIHQAIKLLEQAREETMAIDAADDGYGFYKLSLLLEITQLYNKIDNKVPANAHLREAETLAVKFDRPEFYGLLAIGQARAGYLQQALETAKKLPDESYFSVPTRDYIFPHYDDRLRAKCTLLDIIIDEQLSKRDIEGALAAAAMLPERIRHGRRLRDKAYKKIVLTQWRWGDVPEASHNIRLVSAPWVRDELLQDLINIQLEGDDIEGTAQFLQRVHSPMNKIPLLIKVAVAQAEHGDKQDSRRNFGEAITIASKLFEDLSLRHFSKIRAFCDIAVGQTQAGDPSAQDTLRRAIELAQPRIQHSLYAGMILSYLAITQVKCGLLQEALRSAESIESLWRIAYTLASIAAVQVEAGNATNARENFQKAGDVASRIKDSGLRDQTLLSVVEQCIKSDQPDAGLQIAQRIELDVDRDRGLLKIVDWYAKRGKIGQAEKVRNEIRIDHQRRQANKSIIYAMIHASNFSSAFEIARKMDGTEQYEVMHKLVEGQTNAGDFSGAALTARTWHTVGRTDRALGLVATAQAKAGDIDGALALTSNEDESMRKASVWLGAARGLLSIKALPIE
jgi:tetratricopeptide (TPR) repeat protein